MFGTVGKFVAEKLPRVNAVTALIIRRQTRRVLYPTALMLLFTSLTRLESIVFEPWRQWGEAAAWGMDLVISFIIEIGLPTQLKRLTIFEDFNTHFAASLQHAGLFSDHVELLRSRNPRLASIFARSALEFERLHVSYMIDARDFFQEIHPHWAWHRLKCLAITSNILLCSKNPHIDCLAMLRQAGLVALKMPSLQTMTVWNAVQEQAWAFIYRGKNPRPTIS
ncbi:hypothetical protein ED733_007202 [Metarhizium rileyi]|uniref:DUF6546 domain-containing protein n=1 Tax=Metarhizium rileyi (strain RCEF 4871) TaxID=1649241 RepID=A0A5C6GGB1_METRR|nr:hypothetical protein ED733_007202 [Metarhizium rileyi]